MDWIASILETAEARRPHVSGRALVIGIGGAVAAGKSRIAEELAEALRARGLTVEIVGGDGFLLPNAVLAERGLMERKGFPESYDADALARFFGAVGRGDPRLEAPTYSHPTYDVEGVRTFPRPDVLIFEGLFALSDAVEPLDLGLYVEAAEEDLVRWYVARFLALGRQHAPRLADRLRAVGGDSEALARDIWDRINGPNLRDHIAATKARADFVLRKAGDHRISLSQGEREGPVGVSAGG